MSEALLTDAPTGAVALIPSTSLVPAEVYAPGGIDKMLADIAAQARSHRADVSTAKGRAALASLALKVARSKTYLDDMGKDLVAEWKTKSSVVDAERRKVRDYLDALKAEVRQPLTEYEEAEEAKKEAIRARISGIRSMADVERTSVAITQRVAELRAIAIDDGFGEMKGAAALAKDAALTDLDAALQAAVQREAEAARLELERIEAEAREEAARAERMRAEEEARAARQQAEAAERAEREAKAETDRAERERQAEARRAAEMAAMQERAEADAKRREAEAAERERRRIATEEAATAAAAAARAADQQRRGAVNREALAAIMKAAGLTEAQGKAIVMAIVQGEIPHLRIEY